MNDIPQIAPDILAKATPAELIELLVTHQDRVPQELFDACVARGDAMVAALADYFSRAETMDLDDPAYDWWMNLHGFWLAGAIPGETAGRLLIDLLRRADGDGDYTLDWVAGHMAWLFANKPAGIAELARALAEDADAGWHARCEAVDTVIGMAHKEGPESLELALDWLADLASGTEDKDVRYLGANVLLDFPRPRHRTLLDSIAAEQAAASPFGAVFLPDSVTEAFNRGDDRPDWLRRGPPWDFYAAPRISSRQKRWREEDAKAARQEERAAIARLYPETYVRDHPKPGRNDPCPCGSGKKYKKCCLPADEARSAAQHNLH